MQSQNLKVMAVDDDAMNLEILVKNLSSYGYDTIACRDGVEAWSRLDGNPSGVDIVLLDKMMPNMSGMEVLARMQQHQLLKNVPVIIQTGDVGDEQMREGIERGAYYYLQKPFDPGVMIALVNAAARDLVHRNEMYRQIKNETSLTSMICEGRFAFNNVADAARLAAALSQNARQPDRINTALLELMINAVEHGNLHIGYEEKARLLASGQLDAEIARRAALPENAEKLVEVQVRSGQREVEVTICDEGSGFRWHKFLDFDPMRLTEPNGRGIATAKLMGTNVVYSEPGNKVTCVFEKG